jgi:UDP-glucose 4-epimerase
MGAVMMRVLVTGGAGFIGNSVVSDLLDRGIQVRVIDKSKGALAAGANANLEVVEAGIEDREAVQQAMQGIDVVCHLADTFSSKPHEVLNIDVKGNINLLDTAAAFRVSHFLFASTHRVYGRPRYVPLDENHPLNPEESGRALYAVFKLANEKLCLWYWREHGLPVTIFRFWWSFGYNIGGKALRNLIDTALKGQPIRVPKEAGGNFLHNEDAASAFYLAMLNDKAYGETFNLSSGVFTSWQRLAELVCDLTGSSSELALVPRDEWHGDVSVGTDGSIPYMCNFDISKVERLIGYRPKYSAHEMEGLVRDAVSRLVLARRES